MNKQLTIELVPKTAWFSNVRSMVSKKDWDTIRKKIYEQANNKCQICGCMGTRHPVECHEIWEYDDKEHIQKLKGMIALCPACHEVKHIGLANVRGRGEIAQAHLAKINKWKSKQTSDYIDEQFSKWKERSTFKWKIDLTWLEDRKIKYKDDRK
jgi:hypothetical protein